LRRPAGTGCDDLQDPRRLAEILGRRTALRVQPARDGNPLASGLVLSGPAMTAPPERRPSSGWMGLVLAQDRATSGSSAAGSVIALDEIVDRVLALDRIGPL
jgi:hypothetical protein